jgi:SAM-dependent methyltransferase
MASAKRQIAPTNNRRAPITAFGSEPLVRLMEYDDVKRVLDIGSGAGTQARILRESGREVTTVSIIPPADFVGDYLSLMIPGDPWDAIWASHVLEHQPNPGLFLRHCHKDLRDGGVLVITVPPAKHNIVGGHLSLWNAGLLLYHLIVAGFDCRAARVSGCYVGGHDDGVPYNLSVIVRKVNAVLPPLVCDNGDIERLAQFFPLPARQDFDGRLAPINW